MNNNNDRKESERTKLENIRFIPNVRIQAEKVTKVRTVDEYGIPGKTEKREVVSFDLTEITVKELKELRKIKGVPMFFLKNDGKYFYAIIPKEFQRMLHFVEADIIGEHKCSPGAKCCKYLSAAPDEMGGCAKVRDGKCKKMEKYDFIKTCYQVIGTKSNVFCVCSCDRCEYNDVRPKLERGERIRNRAKLRAFCDFETTKAKL